MIDTPLPATPTAVSVTGISTFAVAAGTFTKVPYATELYDDADEYDTTTNRFTPKAAGDYLVCASITGPNQFEIDLFVNEQRHGGFGFSSTSIVEGCRAVHLAVGDYVDVRVYSTTMTYTTNADYDYLTIYPVTLATYVKTSAAFSVNPSTFTTVPYDMELVDTLGAWDTTTKQFTAPSAGDYMFCGSIHQSGPSTNAEMDLYVDGARTRSFTYNYEATTGCRTLRLAANAVVNVQMYQFTGAAISVPQDLDWNWLQILQVPTTFSVESMSQLVLPNVTNVLVPYTGEAFDEQAQFDVGTHQFTAASAGDYLFCGSINFQTTTAPGHLMLYKNGTKLRGLGHGPAAITGCNVLRLATGDQISVDAYQASGSQLTLNADTFWFWLQASKLK